MAEHVIPESFGGFRDNLTLHEVVCDGCNQFFGKDIELYLARDTPDGLNRFLMGGKDHKEFKSLGKGSSLVRRVKSGFLKGAYVTHRAGDGPRELVPLPQIGFGTSKAGPFKWFTVDHLPTREELEAFRGEGLVHVQFCEIDDPAPVLAELGARGVQVSGEIERVAGPRSEEEFQIHAQLGMKFGRAITKITLNYVAHQYGAATALMAQFNKARRFVRYGAGVDEQRMWEVVTTGGVDTGPVGHRISIEWDRRGSSVAGEITFHRWARYRVALGSGFLVLPPRGSCHFFDLTNMTVRRIM